MSANAKVAALRDAVREIETERAPAGLRITIERVISFSNPAVTHGLRIERERERRTASGRQGKPEPIVVLVNNPDESPTDMLRTLADLIDQEDES
jgi:hypothetical protein